MPTEIEVLLSRLIGGDATAAAEILDRARSDDSPRLLVAAALVAEAPQTYLTRAVNCATTTRDRQLVSLATAHLDGDADLLDALARDHLADHPDSVIAAWIAAQHARPANPSRTSPDLEPTRGKHHVRHTFEGR
jgi:hypothetical protein